VSSSLCFPLKIVQPLTTIYQGGGIEKRRRKITSAKSQMENPIPFHPFHSIPPSDITIKYPIQISKSIG
jgi:hypothetical protein